MSNGALYLIPSPIAEGESWTFDQNTVSVIKSLQCIVCERIRTTRRLIRKYFSQEEFDQIQFIEIDKHNARSYVKSGIERLNKGDKVGIMSEAGVPCIGDPGYLLVLASHRRNVVVQPLVGPCSFVLALMASGFSGQAFSFHGYLPRKEEELAKVLRRLENAVLRFGQPQIFMETPYRNQKLFESILRIVDDQLLLSISIDLTAINQEIRTRSIAEWKRVKSPFDEKRPAVFIFGKPQ